MAGERHHAAVREPPADPSLRHVIVALSTITWPSGRTPRRPPSILTSRSRASTPLTEGQGCPTRQLLSISRAATPAIRTLGPSAHQMGPSPSHTATGVQLNSAPERTACAGASPAGRKFHPITAAVKRRRKPRTLTRLPQLVLRLRYRVPQHMLRSLQRTIGYHLSTRPRQ